jgi:hypothetical protein
MLIAHVLAGLLALVTGMTALLARKGSALHRRSGYAFVLTMLSMSATAVVLALAAPAALSAVAGALTFYLVLTAVLTVQRRPPDGATVDAAAAAFATAVGLVSVALGLEALGHASGLKDGQPAALYFAFGAIALLAALLDVRMLLAGGVRGPHRIARHLWRMCFALLLASAAFFLGQADVFPAPLRNVPLLAAPVVAVLVAMLHGLATTLYRVRGPRRRTDRAL